MKPPFKRPLFIYPFSFILHPFLCAALAQTPPAPDSEEAALREQVQALIARWDDADPRERSRAEDELVRLAPPDKAPSKSRSSEEQRRRLERQRVLLEELNGEARRRGDDLDFLIRYERVITQRTRLWVLHEGMRRRELERQLRLALAQLTLNWRSQEPLTVEWPEPTRLPEGMDLLGAHFEDCLVLLTEAARGAQSLPALFLLGELFKVEHRAHLDAALSLVEAGLRDPNAQARITALRTLERIGTDDELPWALAALHDADRSVRWGAVRVIAGYPDRRIVPALIGALDDPELDLRFAAALALERVTGRPRGFNAYSSELRRQESVASWRAWWSAQGDDFSFAPGLVPPRKFQRPKPGASSAAPPGREETSPAALSDGGTDAHRLYQVVAGDTLGLIARKFYGDARHWRRIVDANPGLDPDRIEIGQQLIIPPTPKGR